MLWRILSWFFKETVNGLSASFRDFIDHVDDPRDFRYEDLGGCDASFCPKSTRVEIKTLSVKNQVPNNTCVFQSLATCREVDEGVVLSPRSAVIYAKTKGFIKGNGLSSIRLGQKVGTDFGVAENSVCPDVNMRWVDYTSARITPAIAYSASLHRQKSTFWVKTKAEYLKALDDGKAIHTGFDWYSSYNLTGGLREPWILPWRKGYKVGGHAVAVVGYDTAKQLLIFQNSFGEDWGDKGKFYVRFDDFFKEKITGAVSILLDGDNLKAFLESFEGKFIKSFSSPVIYKVENGKKRPFLNELVFFADGGTFDGAGGGNFKSVANLVIEKIPTGEPIA